MAAPIERASGTDLSIGALSARSAVPENLGALLVLAAGTDEHAIGKVLARRLAHQSRLRQRLVRVPPGAGRPVWLDDPGFDVRRHVQHVTCPAPGDERALLDLTAELLTTPLPRDRPLWRAVVVRGLADGAVGVVLSLHHVLVDGMGGVAMLGRLADRAADEARTGADDDLPAPRPRPSYRRLVADGFSARLHGLRRAPAAWRGVRRMTAAGGGIRPTRAASCSLTTRTGARRRLAVARADVQALHAAAHRFGGTVNDALLAALAGALAAVLEHRGETLDVLRVTVMVTGRRTVHADELGNAAAPLVVEVPMAGGPLERLSRIAGRVRNAREAATGTPLIGVFGTLFRITAALGVYRWYLRRQRRFHTVLSDVPGPEHPLALAGAPLRAVVPVAVGEMGNVTVHFLALSYAGTLTVTVVADPAAVPDLPLLTSALQRDLDILEAAGRDCPCRASAPRPGGDVGPDNEGRPAASGSRSGVAESVDGPATGGPMRTPGGRSR